MPGEFSNGEPRILIKANGPNGGVPLDLGNVYILTTAIVIIAEVNSKHSARVSFEQSKTVAFFWCQVHVAFASPDAIFAEVWLAFPIEFIWRHRWVECSRYKSLVDVANV